jgi:hypothetical protein
MVSFVANRSAKECEDRKILARRERFELLNGE